MDETPIPATSGIYRITCTTTGKFYIGSAINLRRRWAQHLYDFRNSIHGNRHMQNAWNKHGEQSFVFEVIELVLPDFQLEREQYWLDKLKPFGKEGFNINREASKPTNAPETRERIRLARLGKTHTPESKEKNRQAHLGKKINIVNDSRRKTLIVTSPDGAEYVVTGLRKFCKEHNLDVSSLMRVAKGFDRGTVCTQHRGWKARFLGTEPKEVKQKIISSEARSNRAEAQKKTLIVTDPNGAEHIVHGISQFAKEHNLDRYHLVQVAQGKRNHHQGWIARFPETETG